MIKKTYFLFGLNFVIYIYLYKINSIMTWDNLCNRKIIFDFVRSIKR